MATETWRNTILVGDVRAQLATLPDESVHCVVTSPPYWGLRDYGTATWLGGAEDCEHRPSVAPISERPMAMLVGGTANIDAAEPVYRATCGACGAKRIDAQLGLEPTPEQYVANMVAVFREVRRVLRKDGTLWLNLGDCYANGNKGGYAKDRVTAEDSLQKSNLGANFIGAPNRQPQDGLKIKDLVGMPWRVAFALQQPYYTGAIREERDRIWMAAIVDGEGCLFLHKRKVGQNNGQGYARKSDTYGAGMEVSNTSEAIVRRCMAITGKGSIVRQEKDRRQPLYRWNLRSNECREVIREIYPYLVGKQKQARLVLGCPSSGADAEAAHAGLIGLHAGVDCEIDFKPPAPMYEPGWYVRSDVIWSKSNPMPESVTDRPTKSHEYLFLLTKSERYFYDAEAIREPMSAASIARISQPNFANQTGGPKDYGPDSNRSMRKTLENYAAHNGVGPKGAAAGSGIKYNESFSAAVVGPVLERNKRTVWEIATQPYAEAHFATYPEALVLPCIQAGTSEHGVCSECGAPWRRTVEPTEEYAERLGKSYHDHVDDLGLGQRGVPPAIGGAAYRTTGWEPTCKHEAPLAHAVVLDPFMGSGTTGLVAKRAGRDYVGIELNEKYAAMAARRIGSQISLF